MDREEIYDSLMRWLTSLTGTEVPSADEVSTGKPIADALLALDPEHFNEIWYEKTISNVEETSNWRVKGITLKKILKSLLSYFTELTGRSISEENQPDVQVAARDCSKIELSKLLQIIVGIGVNCPNRTAIIANISTCEESVQRCVMMTVEELEGERRNSVYPSEFQVDPHLELQLKKALSDLELANENRDDLAKRCADFENLVAQLQEEKRILTVEKQQLEKRRNLESDDEQPGSKKIQILQKRLDDAQEEVFRLEAVRDETRSLVNNLQKENKEMSARIESFGGGEAEFQKLKDELDELRVKAAEAKKYESSIEMYKRKLDEMGHMRSELKILEDKNSAYMKSAIDLEEEQRKNSALKTQLEAYKRQLQEVDAKLTDEVKRADKAEFEANRSQEKLQAAMLERDRLAAERDTLKDLSDELKMLQIRNSSTASVSDDFDAERKSGSTPELKSELQKDLQDRLIRLEHENKLLKAMRSTCQDEKIELIQGQLDDAARRKQELETELRLANQKIFEFESRFADLNVAEASNEKSDQNRLVELHRVAELHGLEAQKANQRLYDTEKMLNDRDQKIKSLESTLSAKESEIKSQEEKFKSYLNKARTVIVALESSGSNMGSGYSRQEFDNLKKELLEKEKLIQRMQEEQERMRIMKEQEERLMTTAFHGLTMQMHRNASEHRLATMAGQMPSSFLSRQRIITSKKSPSSSHQQHNSSFR